VSQWYRGLGQASVSFALIADVALLLLGGELKRRERLSGRFADILGEMYFMSCALKRFEDEGRRPEDLPLLEWVCRRALYTIEQRLDAILNNLPSRAFAWLLRRVVFLWGLGKHPASDALGHTVAALLLQPSETRDRLTAGLFISRAPADITGRLEQALEIVPRAEAIEKRLAEAAREGRLSAANGVEAAAKGILNPQEIELLERAERAIRAVIDVDSFAPEELTATAPLVESSAAIR
jgi:acyl-CoA dehydrogenase